MLKLTQTPPMDVIYSYSVTRQRVKVMVEGNEGYSSRTVAGALKEVIKEHII